LTFLNQWIVLDKIDGRFANDRYQTAENKRQRITGVKNKGRFQNAPTEQLIFNYRRFF
jgi:hypothetical protein